MKKIIFVLLFSSISFSQTGNDFLSKYPFGKKVKDMGSIELTRYNYYQGLRHGIVMGNVGTLNLLWEKDLITVEQSVNLFIPFKICTMTDEQQIRIIKKWCDDNPEKTHLTFEKIILSAFSALPVSADCFE